jgi:hypothetical protein
MKKQYVNVIKITVSIIIVFTIGYIIGNKNYKKVESPQNYKDVGGNIDIEYYLEVSEDSIWVEGVQSKRVYSGKYSDLDSLIIKDNL